MDNRTRWSYFYEYVEGWDDHDPQHILAQFAEGGTYDDPVTTEPLEGAELEQYYAKTIAGVPDLQFVGHVFDTQEDGVLINQWTATGTQTGTYFGLPPTGRRIAIDGVSIFSLSEDGIDRINCYFDRRAVKEQLGLSFPGVISQIPRLIYGGLTEAIGRG